MKKIIDVPEVGDRRFKKWAKTVDSVDINQSNGYAFVGKFISDKAELEVGSHILSFGYEGSRANNKPLVAVYRVTTEGTEEVYRKEDLSSKWALDVRDDIAEIVNNSDDVNPLDAFSTEELISEIERRKNI